MQIAGLCSVCNKPTADLNTCWKCGSLVCSAHFRNGLCIRCLRGKTIGEND